MGCLGFLGRSTCKALAQLGVSGAVKRETKRSTTEAAEKATQWLLIKRVSPSMLLGCILGQPRMGHLDEAV